MMPLSDFGLYCSFLEIEYFPDGVETFAVSKPFGGYHCSESEAFTRFGTVRDGYAVDL